MCCTPVKAGVSAWAAVVKIAQRQACASNDDLYFIFAFSSVFASAAAQMPIEQLFGILNAFVFQQFGIRFGIAVQ